MMQEVDSRKHILIFRIGIMMDMGRYESRLLLSANLS